MRQDFRFLCFLTLSSCCLSNTVLASDSQLWVNLNSNIKFAQKGQWYFEEQSRWGDHGKKLAGNIIRTALGRSLPYNFAVFLGYAFVTAHYPLDFFEHRYFLQASHTHLFASIAMLFSQRARLEYRHIEHRPNAALRGRYLFRLQWKFWERKDVFLISANEFFWNLNTVEATADRAPATPARGFEQARLFLGVGKRFFSRHFAEGGYMYNPVRVRYQKDRVNHVLALGYSFAYP